MSEIVLRASRALMNSIGLHGERVSECVARRAVRDAIAAMREPSADQQFIGGAVALDEIRVGRTDQSVCVGMDGAKRIWGAMIDEALKK